MNTYIIISSNINFINQKIALLKENFNVQTTNFNEIKSEKPIGIEEVRNIHKLYKLKPYNGGNRLVVIYDIDKSTIEAQNALLKILEEPPISNFIILTSKSKEQVLPTILSRCQILEDPVKFLSLDKNDYDKYKYIFCKISQAKIGERIKLVNDLVTTREETLRLLSFLSNFLETLLFTKDSSISFSYIEITQTIDKIIKAIRLIEGNINYKAVTDLLFLSFPTKISTNSKVV
jgi:hypothetical protein